MLIFGSRSAYVRSVELNSADCLSCGQHGSLVLRIFRKHAHIFWVPLFPIGKTGFSECRHCKNVLRPKEMPEEVRSEYQRLKAQGGGPIWQFSGLVIFLALFVAGYFANKQDKAEEQKYLAAPQKGDVYEYKLAAGRYSTLKIVSTSEDSVFVVPNDYEINKMSKVRTIDKPLNYTKSPYGISKEMLKKMHDSGEIMNIRR